VYSFQAAFDTTAQYYNPAAFGFFNLRDGDANRLRSNNNNIGRKKWGVDLNAGGGYRLHYEFARYLVDLEGIDIDALSERGVENESDLRDLIDLIIGLDGLDQPAAASPQTSMPVSGSGPASSASEPVDSSRPAGSS
jgi:hypothetical protein